MYRPIVAAFMIVMTTPHLVLAAAPVGLLNKSIHISYALMRPGRTTSGFLVKHPRVVSWTVYVSSAGRVFGKVHQSNGHQTYDREHGPDAHSSAQDFQIVGSKLIHDAKVGNHATRWIVSFDNTFTSCNLQVIPGVEPGTTATWTGLNGKKYVATGPAIVSGEHCSIQDGNAFAN